MAQTMQSTSKSKKQSVDFQRLIEVAAKSSARGVMTIAAAGLLYSLFPDNPAALAALSPVLANWVQAIGGNVLAGMLEKIASLDDPTPQEIEAILQETLRETQTVLDKLETLPTKREFYAVLSRLDEKQDDRWQQLTGQQQEVLRLLQQIADKPEAKEAAFDVAAGLSHYQKRVQQWYNTLRVLNVEKPLTDVYTDVYLVDKQAYARQLLADVTAHERQFAQRNRSGYWIRRQAGVEVLSQNNRLFILGQPGAGKTTFLRWLALRAVQGALPMHKIPLYVALKELAVCGESVETLLAQQLELGGFPAPEAGRFLEAGLRSGNLLLLLDGLDEVPAEQHQRVETEIERLAKKADGCHLVVTCREYAQARLLERFTYSRMADFLPKQVSAFVRNWFADDPAMAARLLAALEKPDHKPIRELTREPLFLALLCIAFAEDGTFPEKRHLLYQRALAAVLREWDETRGVQRTSAYGQLSTERRETLLAYLAYHTFSQEKLFIEREILVAHLDDWWRLWRSAEIERQKEEYGQVYPPELPPANVDAAVVIQEIAAQHGLLVEQRAGIYSFSHLTLQEYFASRHIDKGGTLPHLIAHMGEDRWREVFLLTAGILPDATDFAEAYLWALQTMVAADQEICRLLYWVTEKSGVGAQSPPHRAYFLYMCAVDCKLGYYRVGQRDNRDRLSNDSLLHDVLRRALDLARALHLKTYSYWNLTLFSDLVPTKMESVPIPDLKSFIYSTVDTLDNLDHVAISEYYDSLYQVMTTLPGDGMRTRCSRDPNLDLVLMIVITFLTHWLYGRTTLSVDLANYLQVYWQRMLSRIQKLGERAFVQALNALPLPSLGAEPYALRTFGKQVRQLAILCRDVGHEWELSETQWDLLARYLAANQVLLECLEVATLPDREAIKSQLLLPPD